MAGPLQGRRIVEFAGIGAAPYCGMLMADLGADVVRIEAPIAPEAAKTVGLLDSRFDIANRGKRAVRLDLKSDTGRAEAEALVAAAEALIEGFRPGVMERLGFAPERCRQLNPRLVYGRMTGWGQTGPLAQSAGHDINYIALSGALHSIGAADGPPAIPLNLLGDYAGGGLLLAFALVSAMLEATQSGKGQVIDAAMSEGAALLMAPAYGFHAAGLMAGGRGATMMDGGAPFYGVYECADGEWLAVGAVEPRFYAELLQRCGFEADEAGHQLDRKSWPALKARLSSSFKTRPRSHWAALLEGSDACVSPVLAMAQAPSHPQHQARETFITLDDVVQPAPAPRFERGPAGVRWPAPPRRTEVDTVLNDWRQAR
jgi:alpha-methylacyl-CoA racemase